MPTIQAAMNKPKATRRSGRGIRSNRFLVVNPAFPRERDLPHGRREVRTYPRWKRMTNIQIHKGKMSMKGTTDSLLPNGDRSKNVRMARGTATISEIVPTEPARALIAAEVDVFHDRPFNGSGSVGDDLWPRLGY